MKTIAILTTMLGLPLFAVAQNADHLRRNHKFHMQKEIAEEKDRHAITSDMATVKPVQQNRKFHMTSPELAPIAVRSAVGSEYLTRNRKFHKTTVDDQPARRKFKNNLSKPPVLSSR